MTDEDILEFLQNSKNFIDADSDDENEMNNAVPIRTSSETKNIMKSIHSYLDAHSQWKNRRRASSSLVRDMYGHDVANDRNRFALVLKTSHKNEELKENRAKPPLTLPKRQKIVVIQKLQTITAVFPLAHRNRDPTITHFCNNNKKEKNGGEKVV
ncbi:hypothetical protein TNCV_926721 [Trichonephila clavipes]|nr:hypothetical protein TNCV_926721 [Trichonephila clavipes]